MQKNQRNRNPWFLLIFGLTLLIPNRGQTQAGTLFIIGGGQRPPELIRDLIQTAQLNQPDRQAVILPMSSSQPDTAAFYAIRQFTQQGLPPEKFSTVQIDSGQTPSAAQIQAIVNADLIYLTGGDQRRFMTAIAGTPIRDKIREAYQKGAVVAGTSAGAALMSQHMLTGDERKHPEYTGAFRTVESENMILKPGLGLLPEAVVDQHFIWRMRFNRLLSVIAEHPALIGLGIDESTAVVLHDGQARVSGVGQVIVLRNTDGQFRSENGLLGSRNMQLDLLLPGETFLLKP